MLKNIVPEAGSQDGHCPLNACDRHSCLSHGQPRSEQTLLSRRGRVSVFALESPRNLAFEVPLPYFSFLYGPHPPKRVLWIIVNPVTSMGVAFLGSDNEQQKVSGVCVCESPLSKCTLTSSVPKVGYDSHLHSDPKASGVPSHLQVI